jgi:hypothetical protein
MEKSTGSDNDMMTNAVTSNDILTMGLPGLPRIIPQVYK